MLYLLSMHRATSCSSKHVRKNTNISMWVQISNSMLISVIRKSDLSCLPLTFQSLNMRDISSKSLLFKFHALFIYYGFFHSDEDHLEYTLPAGKCSVTEFCPHLLSFISLSG